MQVAHISDLHFVDVNNASVIARGLHNLSTHVSKVATYYAYAEPRVQQGLLLDLPLAANGLRTVVVLSGDISAWPGDPPRVVDDYYSYIDDVINRLPPGSELLPILGNHDWGNTISPATFPVFGFGSKHTVYSQTRFEFRHNITKPRVDVRQDGGVTAVFFMIESNVSCIPATGIVSQTTLDWLTDTFARGRNDLLGITSAEYIKAVKILILHHSPLPLLEYNHAISANDYLQLQLINADPLLHCCKDNVDMLLFGHTHIPVARAYQGFLTINAGAALSIHGSPFNANFHMIRILDCDTVEVETFYWLGTSFSSSGSKPITFKRGTGSTARGYGRWG